MARMTSGDFNEVETSEDLDVVMATGFGPSGEPGTTEHAENVADSLEHADEDIYYDFFEGASSPEALREAAAAHANISSLQSAASYAAAVMRALARNPAIMDDLRQVMTSDGPRP